MSAMANTTPIVATVMKTSNKEKTQKEMEKLTSRISVRNITMTSYPLSWIKSVAISEKKFMSDWTSEKAPRKTVPDTKTIPDTKTTSATLKSRTMVSTPTKGLGPSTEDPPETDVDPGARGDGGKANLHHPVDLKAAPVTRAIGSQEIKGARRWRKTWSYLGAARM
ncbi:hypothetical protein Tco_0607964 [Tanacetum coccineum]